MVLHIDGKPLWNEDVYVGRSSQRDEKWGLFANRHIQKSSSKEKSWIIEFKGDLVREENLNKIVNRGYYVLFSRDAVEAQLDDGYCSPVVVINVDPFSNNKSNCLDRIGGFAVHAFGLNTNAIARQDYNLPTKPNLSDMNFYKMYLYPTRTIKEDEEIVWEYAETYFCGSKNELVNED